MTDSTTPPPEPILIQPPPPTVRTSLHRVARQISGRTTDLIAIAVVLIGGLTLGRQILIWWHEDPLQLSTTPVVALPDPTWGANDRPVQMILGDSEWRLTRQTVSQGGEPAALEVLRTRCRDVLQRTPAPTAPPDQQTQQILKALKNISPEAEQPGDWRIYLLDQFPRMVLGVRDGQTEGAQQQSTSQVVCWGFVLTTGTRDWSTSFFERLQTAEEPTKASVYSDFQLAEITAPPGGRRILALAEANQGGLVHLMGPGPVAVWQAHLATSLKMRAWKPPLQWNTVGGTLRGQFTRGTEILDVLLHAQGAEVTAIIQWLEAPDTKTPQPADQTGVFE